MAHRHSQTGVSNAGERIGEVIYLFRSGQHDSSIPRLPCPIIGLVVPRLSSARVSQARPGWQKSVVEPAGRETWKQGKRPVTVTRPAQGLSMQYVLCMVHGAWCVVRVCT